MPSLVALRHGMSPSSGRGQGRRRAASSACRQANGLAAGYHGFRVFDKMAASGRMPQEGVL